MPLYRPSTRLLSARMVSRWKILVLSASFHLAISATSRTLVATRLEVAMLLPVRVKQAYQSDTRCPSFRESRSPNTRSRVSARVSL